jgi:hypothetical protein
MHWRRFFQTQKQQSFDYFDHENQQQAVAWYCTISYFLRCRHKENASFGDDAELSQAAENYKKKLRLLVSETSDDLSRACDHFHLQYATNLRTMAESLATHACVGESATHNEVEIIGPGKPWCAKPSLPSSLKSFRFRSQLHGPHHQR